MHIPYGKQSISDDDIQSVVSVLKSDWLTQGPVVPKFESSIADLVNCKHAIAVNSATSALHIACKALGVGSGDVVWTSPISFVASANCAIYCGASIDFVDIDIETYNIDVNKLEEKLRVAEMEGVIPKCVIPVHLSGRPCDMKSIHKLSLKYGFKIIEDASHAIGAKLGASLIGSCKYSDITVFSFHPVKIITTGEGGMALTNDSELTARMAMLRSHGVTRDENQMSKKPDGQWYYEQQTLGFNYRMTDIAAALGLSQLASLNNFVEKRNRIADTYDKLLNDLPVITPTRELDAVSSFHLYVIRIKKDCFHIAHKDIFNKLRLNGVGVNLHYIPIYRHPFYEKFGFDRANYPASEHYYESAISIPIFPSLKYEDQERIVDILKSPHGYQNMF